MDETVVTDFTNFVVGLDDFPLAKSLRRKFVQDFIRAIVLPPGKFVLSLDTIAEWMFMLKGNLKRTLVKSFIANIDYEIHKQKTKGRPKETILLTTHCFKRLCHGQTIKEEQVRSCFKWVKRMYRDLVLNGDETTRLTKEAKRTPIATDNLPVGLCVFILRLTRKDGHIVHKMGKTRNLKKRFTELRRLLHTTVDLLHFALLEEHEGCADFLFKKRKFNELDLAEIYEAEIGDIITQCQKLHENARCFCRPTDSS